MNDVLVARAPIPTTASHDVLLLTTVALLPLVYVPLELHAPEIPTTYGVVSLALVTSLRRGAHKERRSRLDIPALVLLSISAYRNLVYSPLVEGTIGAGPVARDIAATLAGLGMFRLARRPNLRPTIIAGFKLAVLMMLSLAAWQLAVGLPRLWGYGYRNGTYYTESGAYRPFGTFRSPTVFAAYLATVAVPVVLLSPKNRSRLFYGGGIAAGLLASETRSAWIGIAVAAVLSLWGGSARWRRAAGYSLSVAVPLVTAATLMNPALFGHQVARAASALSAGDTSKVTRLELWRGVTTATMHGNPWMGFGEREFREVLYPYVGSMSSLGHAHSNYFQELYRNGVLGLAALVALLIAMLREAASAPKMSEHRAVGLGVVAVFLVDSIFNNALESANYVVTLFVALGLGCAASGRVYAANAHNGAIRDDRKDGQ